MTRANPEGNFLGSNCTNNTAWNIFQLTYENMGNARIVITGHSPCGSLGMCGERSTNRSHDSQTNDPTGKVSGQLSR